MTEEELIANLRDPYWRIRNLYYIKDKEGKTILFRPNDVQDEFIKNIWFRNVIPKARQRGFSTVVQLLWLDTCLFNENIGAAIIAQDIDTAKAIRDEKIKFAYDRLPEVIRKMVPIKTDNVTKICWANGSFLVVALSARGLTLQRLHVSEYGKICAKYPDKAREIQTGAFPSVGQNGIIVVESTAEGNEGPFYEMVQDAKALQDSKKQLAKMDYRLHFASWWDADDYEAEPERAIITEQDNRYFDTLETKIGRSISKRKRAWYVLKRKNDFGGDPAKMWQEFPSTIEEAFQLSNEGAYLTDQLTAARKEGRIGHVPYDMRVPVNTFWDLGVNDDIAIWFHQRVGQEDHFIDFMEGTGEPYNYYVAQMQAKGYVYGKHYLPHDGLQRRPGTEVIKTSADMLADLGLTNIEIVPRVAELTAGIQQLRMDFNHYWFDETACALGLKHLENYRKDWNDRMGVWSTRPRHNGHQHAADALRQKAQMADEFNNTNQSNTWRRPVGGMAV